MLAYQAKLCKNAIVSCESPAALIPNFLTGEVCDGYGSGDVPMVYK